MWWEVIAQAAPWCLNAVCGRLPQFSHLAQQQINLQLLAGNDQVQLLHQVFGVSCLDFKIGQALVCGFLIFHARGSWTNCY